MVTFWALVSGIELSFLRIFGKIERLALNSYFENVYLPWNDFTHPWLNAGN